MIQLRNAKESSIHKNQTILIPACDPSPPSWTSPQVGGDWSSSEPRPPLETSPSRWQSPEERVIQDQFSLATHLGDHLLPSSTSRHRPCPAARGRLQTANHLKNDALSIVFILDLLFLLLIFPNFILRLLPVELLQLLLQSFSLFLSLINLIVINPLSLPPLRPPSNFLLLLLLLH